MDTAPLNIPLLDPRGKRDSFAQQAMQNICNLIAILLSNVRVGIVPETLQGLQGTWIPTTGKD